MNLTRAAKRGTLFAIDETPLSSASSNPTQGAVEHCQALKSILDQASENDRELIRDLVRTLLESNSRHQMVRERISRGSAVFRLTKTEIETIRNNSYRSGVARKLANSSSQVVDSWKLEPNGDRWPANRVSFKSMQQLRALANCTGKPINQIVKEAVEAYIDQARERLKAI